MVEHKRASVPDVYYQQFGGESQTLIAVSPELDCPVPCSPGSIEYEQPHYLPMANQHSDSKVDRIVSAIEVAGLDGPTSQCCTVTLEQTGLSCHDGAAVSLTHDNPRTGCTNPYPGT